MNWKRLPSGDFLNLENGFFVELFNGEIEIVTSHGLVKSFDGDDAKFIVAYLIERAQGQGEK